MAFHATYECFSILGNQNMSLEQIHTVEAGDKVIMPPEALRNMNRLKLEFPLHISLKSAFPAADAPAGPQHHCGILEFSAPSGKMFIPSWMMRNMALQEGGKVRLKR